jgi:hypothetical protein
LRPTNSFSWLFLVPNNAIAIRQFPKRYENFITTP